MKLLNKKNKCYNITLGILKILLALTCLYFFICSLDFLSTAFRLLAGRNTSKVFSQSDLLQNPIVGVMLGILATVLVQSSSTTTSIIVGMVASGILGVPQAIPMIMGSNIGTSVTNTIVSLTQIGVRAEFERAFACAVIHDFFNWLTVITLFVLEVTTGFLFRVTSAIVDGIQFAQGEEPPDVLKAITQPFTRLIVQIDKHVLEGWSLNQTEYENVTSLLKQCAPPPPEAEENALPAPPTLLQQHPSNHSSNDSVVVSCSHNYLFLQFGLSDVWLGLILLLVALFLLCLCLVLLVKILNSLMKDRMAEVIRSSLNAKLPYVPWLTGYLAMLIGAVITFFVQSSSVFTSTLTPLVGAGLFSLERAYPLTLGSNIGTTTTGMLAALAADGKELRNSLQIALCHLLFNVTGILLFYPVPFMRWPIPLAKVMGRTVARYRWFAIFYVVFMFFLFPLMIFSLSLIGPVAIYVGFVPPFLVFLVVVVINVVQAKRPGLLPKRLRDWNFLPEWMRSLDPYDRVLSKVNCCKRFQQREEEEEDSDVNELRSNYAVANRKQNRQINSIDMEASL